MLLRIHLYGLFRLAAHFLHRLAGCLNCMVTPALSGTSSQSPVVATLLGPTFLPYPWLAFDLGCILPIKGSQPTAVYFGCVYNIGKLI